MLAICVPALRHAMCTRERNRQTRTVTDAMDDRPDNKLYWIELPRYSRIKRSISAATAAVSSVESVTSRALPLRSKKNTAEE